MAPQRKRENRVNQFYNVGVQGRKTGITIADRGVYDEHGLEPISGIFSSPEKSPPKRGGTTTASESTDIQESSIPDLTTSHQILRNARTHLPPPRSRSPKKTALGSSPRRQSSMAPRHSSVNASSPAPVARRLEFEQDESSLQETPALSGSGQRRGKRADVYDIPEDGSPAPQTSAILEEIFEEDEITADGDSVVIDGTAEESFIAQIGDDTTIGPAAVEDVLDMEESEVMLELVKEPAKRGRKRKSDVLEPAQGDSTTAAKSRKRGATSAQVSDGVKKGKRVAPAPNVPYRRSKRVSDINELESSAIDISADAIAEADEAPVAPKRRGRPPRAESQANKENAASTKASKPTVVKDKEEHVFKKPPKPATRPKEVKNKASVDAAPTIPQIDGAGGGKLVDVTGKPLSKKDIEQMSTTTVGSRYGRGRHLSVFRELEPEAVARIGRTGRHRVAPIDFWKNDRISYDTDGSMTSVVKNQDVDSPRKQYKSAAKPKGKKRSLTAIEEEEGELEPWEEEDGMLKGNYRDYDPVTDVISNVLLEATIAWAEKGIEPVNVPDESFKYIKLANMGPYGNCGVIELRADQMKRTKNSRRMHMVFTVQSGTVEVKVHENEFTVHRNGVWQVPRGNTYSIRNVGSGTARVFFAQTREKTAGDEE